MGKVMFKSVKVIGNIWSIDQFLLKVCTKFLSNSDKIFYQIIASIKEVIVKRRPPIVKWDCH